MKTLLALQSGLWLVSVHGMIQVELCWARNKTPVQVPCGLPPISNIHASNNPAKWFPESPSPGLDEMKAMSLTRHPPIAYSCRNLRLIFRKKENSCIWIIHYIVLALQVYKVKDNLYTKYCNIGDCSEKLLSRVHHHLYSWYWPNKPKYIEFYFSFCFCEESPILQYVLLLCFTKNHHLALLKKCRLSQH